jgi:hypothetical protein
VVAVRDVETTTLNTSVFGNSAPSFLKQTSN